MYLRTSSRASRRIIGRSPARQGLLQPHQRFSSYRPLTLLRGRPAPTLTRFQSTNHLNAQPSLRYSTSTMTALQEQLNPALLRELHDFWFEGCKTEAEFVLPKQETMMKWFMGGDDFDAQCVKRFLPALEAIRAAGITTSAQVLEAAKPQSPAEWVSLLLLLDQMPRNCYRGAAASTAFTVFDPIAQGVALKAIQQHNIPDGAPEVRWQFGRRPWFYLPLMHSESPDLHDLAIIQYGRMAADMDHLIQSSPSESPEAGEWERRAAAVVRADAEGAKKFVASNIESEQKHYDIIKKFGRYPHRNAALGRELTTEEVEYLANGGETFGAPAKKAKTEA